MIRLHVSGKHKIGLTEQYLFTRSSLAYCMKFAVVISYSQAECVVICGRLNVTVECTPVINDTKSKHPLWSVDNESSFDMSIARVLRSSSDILWLTPRAVSDCSGIYDTSTTVQTVGRHIRHFHCSFRLLTGTYGTSTADSDCWQAHTTLPLQLQTDDRHIRYFHCSFRLMTGIYMALPLQLQTVGRHIRQFHCSFRLLTGIYDTSTAASLLTGIYMTLSLQIHTVDWHITCPLQLKTG